MASNTRQPAHIVRMGHLGNLSPNLSVRIARSTDIYSLDIHYTEEILSPSWSMLLSSTLRKLVFDFYRSSGTLPNLMLGYGRPDTGLTRSRPTNALFLARAWTIRISPPFQSKRVRVYRSSKHVAILTYVRPEQIPRPIRMTYRLDLDKSIGSRLRNLASSGPSRKALTDDTRRGNCHHRDRVSGVDDIYGDHQMTARRNVFYQQQVFLGYELERYAISSGWQQVNVRINGLLARSFLSVEAAKRWCEVELHKKTN